MATPSNDIKSKVSIEHIDTLDKPQNVVPLDKFGAATEYTPEEKSLVRKLDTHMMPMLWVMYFMNFLDRNAIVNGKINGMDKDLNLQGTEYNTCVSIFFVGRIEQDTTQKQDKVNVWKGLREAAVDYRTWIFALMQNLHLSANGFKNFLPTVVKTLGFNQTITLVLTCPPYLISAFVSVAVSWSSGRFNERTWHITLSKAVAIVGFIVGTATLNIGARYFAMVLFVGATYGVNNIVLAWTAAVLGQTDEKKSVALAIVNTLGNLSFVYTPYLWPDTDAPRFGKAMYASVGFSAGVVLCAWVMRLVLMRDNKKIRASDNEAINFYVY
ncbi:unnamed protein product [Alternaria alternata]